MHLKLGKVVAFMLHRSYHKKPASQITTHRKSLHFGARARVWEEVQGSEARWWGESGRDAGRVLGMCLPLHRAQCRQRGSPWLLLRAWPDECCRDTEEARLWEMLPILGVTRNIYSRSRENPVGMFSCQIPVVCHCGGCGGCGGSSESLFSSSSYSPF